MAGKARAVIPRVACIGECMIELRELPSGQLQRSWGGDTLNTALYLARLGVSVDYVTALGDDDWSGEMIQAWQDESIGTKLVHRLPGCLPGLYIIQTNAAGERRFQYWRDSAAAKRLFDHVDIRAFQAFDTFYLSGITLSIFDTAARASLIEALTNARARGASVAFDTNFRPRGWPDIETARALYRAMFALATLVFASVEDLSLLFGDEGENELLDHAAGTEIVLKLERPASRLFHAGAEYSAAGPAVATVVDTTAAGDSFAAAYLAARLRGASPQESAKAGHILAAVVVQFPGAIVPRAAMPLASEIRDRP